MNAQLTTQPTLEMIDPRTLTVDVNVRKDAALTPSSLRASRSTA
ncbi:hypothetical protein ACX80N_16485 [Arthrobacter sp. MDT2-16]